MPDYKQKSGFKKTFSKGAPRRPSYEEPKEMFRAECSNCHEMCEVPFRPNGSKPVFCRNCFNRDRSEDNSFSPARSFQSSSKGKFSPSFDRRPSTDVAQQLVDIDKKLDMLVRLIKESR